MIRLVVFLSLIINISAFRDGDEVCIMNKHNQCPRQELKISQTDSSTLIYPGGKTRCAFDNYHSQLFKTNSTYFFQVFPKNHTRNLLLYFQPGGACNSNQTCNFASQCSLPRRTFQVNAVAKSTGVLDVSNPDNLFHYWNIVHLPYCTGDIHVGNVVKESRDYKFSLLRDSCKNKNMTMHMNGYENSMAALNWALANYPNPHHIVVAGSSAGALGAQLLADRISTMWKIKERNIKYAVIADSYVGVFPHGKTTGGLLNFLGACHILPDTITAKCIDGTATSVEIMQHILRNTLFADWLHITSLADWVQRFFTKLLDVGLDRSIFFNILDPFKFFSEMNDIITGEKEASTRISAFFVEGTEHIFLLDDDWYKTQRAGTKQTLGSFLRIWLETGETGEGTPAFALPTPPPSE